MERTASDFSDYQLLDKSRLSGSKGRTEWVNPPLLTFYQGSIKPNLGDWRNDSPDWDEVIQTFPRGELRDYLALLSEEGVTIAVKPQYIDRLPKIFEGEVRELLERVDDRGEIVRYSESLGIEHILSRKLGSLSGGGVTESCTVCYPPEGNGRVFLR